MIDLAKDTGIFAAIEPDQQWIANGVIGCSKNNIHMKTIINKLEDISMNYSQIRTRKGVSKVTGPLFFRCIQDKITVFPSVYFYPISWHKVTNLNAHKEIKISEESYMFQYGYTTNNLENYL